MAGATSRVSRVLMTGPLAPFAEAYRRELRERGYTERSAVKQLRQVARFSRWLADGNQLSVSELSADRVQEFLGWQHAVGRHRSQWSRPGLVCLLDVLRELGVPGGWRAGADGLAGGGAAGRVRALPGGGAWPGGGYRPRLCEPCPPVPGWAACRRWPGRRVRQGRDRGGAARSAAVLVSAAQSSCPGSVISPLLLHRAPDSCRSVAGGAAGDCLALAAAPGDDQGRRRGVAGGCDRRSALGRATTRCSSRWSGWGCAPGSWHACGWTTSTGGRGAGRAGQGRRQDRLPLPAEVGQAVACDLEAGTAGEWPQGVFL